MSVEKRVTFTPFDEPVVNIKITGSHDVFRFAWAISHLQCDFADVGRRIAGSLKRHMGTARFREFQEHFTSNKSLRWLRDDEAESPHDILVPLSFVEAVLYSGSFDCKQLDDLYANAARLIDRSDPAYLQGAHSDEIDADASRPLGAEKA